MDNEKPMTPDVPAICASLTKAQRQAMTSDGYMLPPMGPYGFETMILGEQYGRSAKALHRLCLLQNPWCPSSFTPRGMEIRAYLKEQQP